MNKTFLAISGILLFITLPKFQLKAQITITQSDMPVAGSVYTVAYDTSGSLSPQSALPTAQTWNYSTLANSETYTYNFVNADWTLYYNAFHTSNLADTLFFAPGYTFYSSTPTSFSESGILTRQYGVTAGVNLHPYFEQIPLPATYGTTDGGLSRGDTTMAISVTGFDSGRATVTIRYWDTVEAFGVMTTPYGGPDSVIRQKHYDYTVDSLFIRSTSLHTWTFYRSLNTENNQYRWYAKGIPYYFVLMQMTNKTAKDSIVEWYDGEVAGTKDISHSAITKVYPNPARTEITFNCSSLAAKFISIFDITGRKISTGEIKNNMLTLTVSSYSAGMYFYKVSDVSGNMIDRGKFSVQ